MMFQFGQTTYIFDSKLLVTLRWPDELLSGFNNETIYRNEGLVLP